MHCGTVVGCLERPDQAVHKQHKVHLHDGHDLGALPVLARQPVLQRARIVRPVDGPLLLQRQVVLCMQSAGVNG